MRDYTLLEMYTSEKQHRFSFPIFRSIVSSLIAQKRLQEGEDFTALASRSKIFTEQGRGKIVDYLKTHQSSPEHHLSKGKRGYGRWSLR